MKQELKTTNIHWPDHRLLDLLGISLPIVQAPMAGASGIDMALGVAEAGGLGSLACAALDAPVLHKLLSTVRDRSACSFNVNFFAHTQPMNDPAGDKVWLGNLSRYYRELGILPPRLLTVGPIQPFDAERCDVVVEHAPEVVSFHFGLPKVALVERIKKAGSLIMSTATTVGEAQWLAENGCDVVIAQGLEAGGHRGMFLANNNDSQMGTLALVPQIVDAVDIPVIAAGGIGDGRGIAAAFALGACGAQIGTAYLFTKEAGISGVYRDALQQSNGSDTVVTNVFSGRPTRALANRITTQLDQTTDVAPAFPRGFSAIGPLRASAESKGSRDFSAHYCGQSAKLGYETTAYQLTRDLADSSVCQIKLMNDVN